MINMKRVIISLILMLFPFNVFAYSNEVILGGNTIGIEVSSDGILIVGFYKINNKYNQSDLAVGDYITKVNDIKVETIKELGKIIEKNTNKDNIKITYKRDNNEFETNLKIIYEDGMYKTGLYVKDSITGIGTLTYIDPNTKIYGALGHEIIESNSGKTVNIKTGKIYKNIITSIDKSIMGSPGSKNAKFYPETNYGNINKNTIYGIYGNYKTISQDNLISVANPSEVKTGSAKIYTVLSNETVNEYEINILSINETNPTKNLIFEISDSELLDKTGGIVQGMSGSPIVQNNKLIGAVTHVIVDNPKTGYGVFITKMLEEGEK